MAIALSFGGLFAPLHALLGGFGRHAPRSRPSAPMQKPVQARKPLGGAWQAASVPAHAPQPATTRPLRVVRVFEGAQPRAAAGRMVISGRLADVCAELDRLAAAEAAAG